MADCHKLQRGARARFIASWHLSRAFYRCSINGVLYSLLGKPMVHTQDFANAECGRHAIAWLVRLVAGENAPDGAKHSCVQLLTERFQQQKALTPQIFVRKDAFCILRTTRASHGDWCVIRVLHTEHCLDIWTDEPGQDTALV